MSCGAARKLSLLVRSVVTEVEVASGVSVVMTAKNVRAAEHRNQLSSAPRTCGDGPTLLPNVPPFGAAAEDRASLRQRVVEKLQALFDRFYVL